MKIKGDHYRGSSLGGVYINAFVEIWMCALELNLLISPAHCSNLIHIQYLFSMPEMN